MLPHADATLRHGEWQHTVPHGKDETERQSDTSRVRVGMRRRAAAGLAWPRARFGGTAAAQGPRRDALAAVAADFAGEAGMDRAALHNLLRAQFLANARLGVNIWPLSIALQGDDATVRFDAVLSGGDARVLPEPMQRYALVTGWREQDGRWRLRHAQWSAAP
ncbi:hypothetical protein [Xanthomonas graminis]|nr:hypothetical protein [Xanthomonas translucens]